MQKFTTKAFSLLPNADEMRSNGPGFDSVVLQNASGTVELEAIVDELDAFTLECGGSIDSDVVDDQVMCGLIEYLNQNRLLDVPV
jgi:hypothetical protein